jgi:ribonucleoside-diphosphate reductase alpha chain
MANRKIGLGVMGFADMLMKMEIPYDSAKARTLATTMMKLFLKRCRQASVSLAKQRGAFPNFKGSALDKARMAPQRNATLTTIAPSGTLSLLAGTTGGIEPAFALSYYRSALEGEEFMEVLPVFQAKMKAEGLATPELFAEVAETGSIQGMSQVPKKLQEVFKTAMDLKPIEHIKMQAVFQKYTDNAVSKTVNLPEEATWEDVYQIYMAAYEQKCKGITVYRYGSRGEQVLKVGKSAKKKKARAVISDTEDCGICISYQ